ncbi:MAG: chemotaxis response regulator protein-glutamate methylesterase [Terriglobales bacterium]
MQPIRVLIVDDSAVIRRCLSDVLGSDPDMAVAGMAGTGEIALTRISDLKPDLITLDIEMPGMSGIETLVEIRKRYPRLPVIMFSSLTGPGAAATVEALARGASDYCAKRSADTVESVDEHIRQELVPKIKSLCGARPLAVSAPFPVHAALLPPQPTHLQQLARIDVLAIGTSTGGPNALAALIPEFPRNFPVPVVIVQHMPPMFTQLLASRLDTLTPLHVQEGKRGEKLEPGQIWIAPGDYHMTVGRKGVVSVLELNQDPPENSCRPAVDVLFRSVAQAFGSHVLAVVLTGMGSDGTRGAAAIRVAGGAVIVQDEASSVVWGMPGNVVAGNLADRVCPLDSVMNEIVRRVSFRRSTGIGAGG